jgi:serine/threonine protein kinase
MSCLEQHSVIHKDLALRNMLVGSPLIIKISDFGLSRQTALGGYYYKGEDTLFSPRWASTEICTHGKFSLKSDVYAFGVCMWELWSYGEVPFGLFTSKDQITKKIMAGEYLSQPPKCPNQVYALMLQCWSLESHKRPTFMELKTALENLRNQSFATPYQLMRERLETAPPS